jgi:hypothetical protein
MFLESGARYLVPIHWDTFRLGKEPLGDAMRPDHFNMPCAARSRLTSVIASSSVATR